MSVVKQFAANVKRAIFNRETCTIGGGQFTPDELEEVLRALQQRDKLLAALQAMMQFRGRRAATALAKQAITNATERV